MCTKIFSSQQRVSHGHGPDTEEHTPSTGWMMTMRSYYLMCPLRQECHFEISGFDLLQVFGTE